DPGRRHVPRASGLHQALGRRGEGLPVPLGRRPLPLLRRIPRHSDCRRRCRRDSGGDQEWPLTVSLSPGSSWACHSCTRAETRPWAWTAWALACCTCARWGSTCATGRTTAATLTAPCAVSWCVFWAILWPRAGG